MHGKKMSPAVRAGLERRAEQLSWRLHWLGVGSVALMLMAWLIRRVLGGMATPDPDGVTALAAQLVGLSLCLGLGWVNGRELRQVARRLERD